MCCFQCICKVNIRAGTQNTRYLVTTSSDASSCLSTSVYLTLFIWSLHAKRDVQCFLSWVTWRTHSFFYPILWASMSLCVCFLPTQEQQRNIKKYRLQRLQYNFHLCCHCYMYYEWSLLDSKCIIHHDILPNGRGYFKILTSVFLKFWLRPWKWLLKENKSV